MTQRTSFDALNCSIARAADVVGEWWTPLILRDVFMGLTKFDELQQDLGISRKVLAQRLDRLVDAGVLQRVAYQEKPLRYDYLPTEKGADFGPVLLAMQAWGDRWAMDQPPVQVIHDVCGHHTTVVPACAECGAEVTADQITLAPGPGLETDEVGQARLARRQALRGM